MIDRLLFASTFVATLGSGVMAGLFFIFSNTIMTALGRLPPPGGIAAMQSINVVILNPTFLATFMGTALLSGLLVIAALFRWSEPGSFYLLAGGLLYLVCSIVVTMVFNVPLNDAIEAADPGSAEAAALWARYLSVWTAWNHVRTIGSLAATASFIMALR
jgi:uncharacterized membrane protein